MKKKPFSVEQMIAVLKQAEAGGLWNRVGREWSAQLVHHVLSKELTPRSTVGTTGFRRRPTRAVLGPGGASEPFGEWPQRSPDHRGRYGASRLSHLPVV